MVKISKDYVCCKTCKFYRHDIINKNSEMWSCTKNNSVNVDTLTKLKDKPCYQPKVSKKCKKVYRKKSKV